MAQTNEAIAAPQTTTSGDEIAVTAAQLFDEFWDLPCSESCTGEMDYSVNAWECLEHRPENVWQLFTNRKA